jgi:nucleotide-binding universal stress UspA family protein
MPTIPRSIVVAVDFGDASARAVAAAGFIAERCHAATLRLLHAESAEAPPYFTSEQLDGLERQRRALQAQAQQYLTRFGRQHTKIPFSAVVDDRPPVDAILHEASTADLVVMGTHGRRGPQRWWLGSVAERVLGGIARPLLIMRAPASAEHATPTEGLFDRTVVHAAAPLVGTTALEYARVLAACAGGDVVDRRYDLIESSVTATRATLLVVAVPEPRTAAWLSNFGEPLVRFCPAPILFVPDSPSGGSA